MDPASLHAAIIHFFLERQRPPSIAELASLSAGDTAAVRAGLRALADAHGVVLHPGSDEIWVAHPFSAAPTTCVVRSGPRTWWGNCAWCSLGLAHLAGGSACIETRLGAIGEYVAIHIEEGRLLDDRFVVHFPVPMRKAWDNVIHTCSVMLFFRSEAEVDAWCAARGIAKGDVRPIAQVWSFARDWYGRHADADWRKWSIEEAEALFRRHGLAGPVWDLSGQDGRF